VNRHLTRGGNFFDKHKSKNPLIRYALKSLYSGIKTQVDDLTPKTIVDIGCGEGHITALLREWFPEAAIYATDLSKSIMVSNFKTKRDVLLMCSDAQELPLKSGSFDIVVCTEVLEHVEDPEKVISECRRISRNLCLFTVPREPHWRAANILRLSYLKRLGNTPGHINHWNTDTFLSLLKGHFRECQVKNSTVWLIASCKKIEFYPK